MAMRRFKDDFPFGPLVQDFADLDAPLRKIVRYEDAEALIWSIQAGRTLRIVVLHRLV